MAGDESVRVLIVDDVAETRENIRKLLQFEKDIEVVGAEDSGIGGVDACRELKPDVVLMDINMPDIDGIAATEMIRQRNPATQIVILSVQGDPNYMRRAMLAGARDFLIKPPAVDELTSALRRAGKMAKDELKKTGPLQALPGMGQALVNLGKISLGKIILVYSPKGGTGATTLAVNLGVSLHSDDTQVVIVDGNFQFGDVAVFLNERVRNSVADLTPRADDLDAEILDEVLLTHGSSGVKILAAPDRPEYAENIEGSEFVKVLEYLRKVYSYIVVDTSSSLSDSVLGAMEISDLIILITTQDIPSLKSARLYLDLAEIIGIDREKILFVMNRFDKRISITPEKVGENLKHDIIAVIPFEERVVVPSINRGVPFMLGDRTRPISKSYLGLVEEVRKRIKALIEAESDLLAMPAKRM